MNNYVVLDTLKYAAPHGEFGPMRNKPATERLTLSGASDVTFGPGTKVEWAGMITAPVTPRDTGWGDIDDLRDTLEKRLAIAFIDHYNVASTVYIFGPHGETSATPMWDAASNEWNVTIRLVVDQGGGALVPLSVLTLASSVLKSTSIGGAVNIEMDEITLVGSAIHEFVSRPVILEELYLASTIHLDGIPQAVPMDTLTLVSSPETSTVAVTT